VTALVARDRRLLRLPLTLPADATTWRLAVRDAAAAQVARRAGLIASALLVLAGTPGAGLAGTTVARRRPQCGHGRRRCSRG
jgi:hypothetical protein